MGRTTMPIDQNHDHQQRHPGEDESVQVVQQEAQQRVGGVGHAEGGAELGHGGYGQIEALSDLGIEHVPDAYDVQGQHRGYDTGGEQTALQLLENRVVLIVRFLPCRRIP